MHNKIKTLVAIQTVVQATAVKVETARVLQPLLNLILTGRFQPQDHKCCFLATLLGRNCNPALAVFCRLGYNNSLIGEKMIKPNTLCLIRGVPHEHLGSEFNGRVVTVVDFKYTHPDGSPIYRIEPVLQDNLDRQFTGCRQKWLLPFSSPDALAATNKTLETV